MTSPLSSASAASRAIRRDPDVEPDDQWKENLKAQIELNLASMVRDAEAQLAENLEKNPGDGERLHREFSAAMDNIRKLATETFKSELDRERHERRWATGHELPPDLVETMKKEQQAILDQIQSGKSSNTSASDDGPTVTDTQESTVSRTAFSRPVHVTTTIHSQNSFNRRSSVSPSMNASPAPRNSKPTQRPKLPEAEPLSDEDTEEESDIDAASNRHVRSQPVISPPRARDDDDTGVSRSSSVNLNRVPRPYSSSTPPKQSPEVWLPPELVSDRPQRRNSTASVRSTGSASAGSRRPTVVETIPEARQFVNINSDVANKAEQERMRIQDADQAWRNFDAAKDRQVGRRRTLDNMKGSSTSSSVTYTNDQSGTSPTVSNMVSSSPSQSRPPPPPLETKPIYRKASFVQEKPTQLYRKPSFVHEPRSFDKVPIPPRSTQSHLSLSRPIEPTEVSSNGESGESPYSQTPPMSATLAYAQAAEGYHSAYSASASFLGSPSPLHDQDADTRIRSRHPSNEPRYMTNPSPLYHNPQVSGTQAYPSPPPSHRNTYSSSPSSRPFPQQPPYSASPYLSSQSSSPYPPFQNPMYVGRTSDDADSTSYENGPSYQQRSWSGNGPIPMPMSALPETRHHSMRSPSGSQDTWRSWSQQQQVQNLRSPMSNSNLREQIQDRYKPAPTYANTVIDAPEGSEEDSEIMTDSESGDSFHQPTSTVSPNTSHSSFHHHIPYTVPKTNVKQEVKVNAQRMPVDEPDEDSLEYQQMLAKRRKKRAAEVAKAVELEETEKNKRAKQAAEEESTQREIARAAVEEAKRQKLAEEKAAARRRKEEEEAKAQRENEAEMKRKETEKRRQEEERLKEVERHREEERQRKKEQEKKRREEEAKRKEEERIRLRKIEEEEARLEQAREEARIEEERRERLRKEEDDLRRRQDEIRKKEEELQRKMLEDKQREFERLEREARRKEAEAKKREQQARLREEEARRKEAEIQERERQVRLAEEELQRREKAAQEEILRREREKAAQEEMRERQEQERLAREEELRERQEQERLAREEELRERQEQERLAQEERERREKAEAAEILLRQKIEKEEQERIESEIAWKEHERQKAEAAKATARNQEQANISRKRRDNERMQIEDEAKRKERERRQREEEERRREAEKIAQQEEFRRREEEIRNRKRQDSAAAWESWTGPTSAGHYPQSSTPLSTTNVNGGTNTSQHSSTSSSTPGWSTKPTSANPAWSRTWSGSSSASATASHAFNPAPSASSVPTSKPRSGSTGASGSTPLSGTPEEQFQERQERFRKEQERLERERLAKSSPTKAKDDEIIKTFEHHARLWEKLPEYTALHWDILPWPMFNKPSSPEDITYAAIYAYLSSPHHPEKDKPRKDRVKDQFRKWHPDRFDTKVLPKVIEVDRVRVKEGAGRVARNLSELLTKSNTPNFFD